MCIHLVHGGWGEWIKSDFCTQPCGIGGVIPFKRYCDNPKPKYRGLACPGSNYKTEPCNEHITCNKCKSIKKNDYVESLYDPVANL